MANRTRNIAELLPLIKYPLMTEKAVGLYSSRQYTFIVDKSITKIEIKNVIQSIFNVTITSVKTCLLPDKDRRVGRFIGKKTQYKKTYVTVKEGDVLTDLIT